MSSSSPEIICIGEALVEMVKLEVDSLHSEVGTYRGPFPSGAPAIFASTAGRLAANHGLKAGFIGSIGMDPFGDIFRDKLIQDGLDVSAIHRDPEATTGIAFVQLNTNGSRSFVFSQGAAVRISSDVLTENYFRNVKTLHISGSSLSLDSELRATCLHAMGLALQVNPDCWITFDPNFRTEMAEQQEIRAYAAPVLERATHLLPSGEELAFLSGEPDPLRACQELFDVGRRLQAIVLKLGARGCHVFTRNNLGSGGSVVPGSPAKECYPTGAGDNFGGTLVTALLAGTDLDKAAGLACAGGALAVEQPGLMKTFTWEDVVRRRTKGSGA